MKRRELHYNLSYLCILLKNMSIIQKQTVGIYIIDVRNFLDCDSSHLHEQQSSKVYYMELRWMKIMTVTKQCYTDDLLEKFVSESQNGWVVLVGDGKTYQHLIIVKRVKRQYGSAM